MPILCRAVRARDTGCRTLSPPSESESGRLPEWGALGPGPTSSCPRPGRRWSPTTACGPPSRTSSPSGPDLGGPENRGRGRRAPLPQQLLLHLGLEAPVLRSGGRSLRVRLKQAPIPSAHVRAIQSRSPRGSRARPRRARPDAIGRQTAWGAGKMGNSGEFETGNSKLRKFRTESKSSEARGRTSVSVSAVCVCACVRACVYPLPIRVASGYRRPFPAEFFAGAVFRSKLELSHSCNSHIYI
jgi:hypothetical protein